ncbi:hypothetical protein IKQ21_01210 [bacterium]|nr:hypothetical protein [bacterium]
MNFKKFEKFFKKHKKFFYSFFGFILVFQILFLAIWFLAIINSIIYYSGDHVQYPLKRDKDLITTDKLSTAIEIEALLAKHGIRAERYQDGTKTRLILPRYRCRSHKRICTQEDYDLAIVILAKSGLNNKSTKFDLFDKTNFFSTREDAQIKLVKTMNEDLAKLIKKLDGIEDAEVIVSVPEQSMFTKNAKPITAAVQVTTSSGEPLNERIAETITNLMTGAVSGLDKENLKLTDTNNNVYYPD